MGKKTSAKAVKKSAVKSTKKGAAKKSAPKRAASKSAVSKRTVAKSGAKKKVAKKSAKKSAKKAKTVAKRAVKKTRASTGAGSKRAAVKGKVVEERSLADDLLRQISEERIDEKESLEQAVFQVEAHKFETQLLRDAAPTEVHVPRELEGDYDESLLVPLVRDPLWVFVYWELHRADRERHHLLYGAERGRQLVLRWHDVTDLESFDGSNAHHCFDVEIGATSGSWYQKLPSAGRNWCLEIGVKNLDGSGFESIIRSRFIKTPPLGIAHSGRESVRWMRVDPRRRTMVVFELPRGLALNDFDDARDWDGARISEADLVKAFESGESPFVLTEQQALRLVPPALLKSFGSDVHLLPGFPGGGGQALGGASETLSSVTLSKG